jgi:hypothetical protein
MHLEQIRFLLLLFFFFRASYLLGKSPVPLLFSATWMALKDIMVSETGQYRKILYDLTDMLY